MQMKLYRIGNWCFRHGLGFMGLLIQKIIFVIYNAVIPSEAEIGEGTIFAHGAVGTVIHPKAKIGKRVLITQGVTIGGKSILATGVPDIGDDVYIGAGAKILGPIHIGNDSLIGANAVVVKSVPPGSLVVGVPGVIKKTGIRARDVESW